MELPTKTDIEERLIDEVAKFPCLFDKANPDYRLAAKREGAWNAISESIEETGIHIIIFTLTSSVLIFLTN